MKIKKSICVLSAFIFVASAFCACGKKAENSNTTTQPSFVVGEEAYTSHNTQYSNVHFVSHMSTNGNIIKNDYLDEKGKIKYSEEFIYDNYGAAVGYNYFNANGKLAAKYMESENKFYDENNKEINEDEFVIKMRAIGASQ